MIHPNDKNYSSRMKNLPPIQNDDNYLFIQMQQVPIHPRRPYQHCNQVRRSKSHVHQPRPGRRSEVIYKNFHNFPCVPVVRDKDQEAGRLVVPLQEEVAPIDDKNLLPWATAPIHREWTDCWVGKVRVVTPFATSFYCQVYKVGANFVNLPLTPYN